MKVLVDMNLSPAWSAFLETAGIQSVHWSKIGPANAPDVELMGWAAEHDCVILTADLDFAAILAAAQERRPSVVQIRSEDLAPQTIGEAVLAALRLLNQLLPEGAIISVDTARIRMRILPL